MMRLLLALAVLSSCKRPTNVASDDAAPKPAPRDETPLVTYRHANPDFSVRVPKGYSVVDLTVSSEVHLDYQKVETHAKGQKGSEASITLTWPDGSYDDLVKSLATDGNAAGSQTTASGALSPGKGRFVVLASPGGFPFARALARTSKDSVVFCESMGPTAAHYEACKTLVAE